MQHTVPSDGENIKKLFYLILSEEQMEVKIVNEKEAFTYASMGNDAGYYVRFGISPMGKEEGVIRAGLSKCGVSFAYPTFAMLGIANPLLNVTERGKFDALLASARFKNFVVPPMQYSTERAAIMEYNRRASAGAVVSNPRPVISTPVVSNEDQTLIQALKALNTNITDVMIVGEKLAIHTVKDRTIKGTVKTYFTDTLGVQIENVPSFHFFVSKDLLNSSPIVSQKKQQLAEAKHNATFSSSDVYSSLSNVASTSNLSPMPSANLHPDDDWDKIVGEGRARSSTVTGASTARTKPSSPTISADSQAHGSSDEDSDSKNKPKPNRG